MMRPGNGYVLVEVPPAITSIKTSSGLELYVDVTFNPEQFANVYATVIGLPERVKNKDAKKHLAHGDNDNRLQVGDTVYFHYLTLRNAKKQYDRGSYWEEEGKRYALIPYASLFFAVRKTTMVIDFNSLPETDYKKLIDSVKKTGVMVVNKHNEVVKTLDYLEEYIMLNQWVLIEPIRKGQHVEHIPMYGNIIVDDELSTEKIAVVTNTPYRSTEGIVKSAPVNCGLLPGERVVFERESDVPVEYDLTRTLDKPYFRMKLEDIIAKRDETTFQLVRDYCLIIKDDAAEETETGFFIPEIAQEQPFRGKVVMKGPDVQEVLENEVVYFERGQYTEFPWGNSTGQLVPEPRIQLRLL